MNTEECTLFIFTWNMGEKPPDSSQLKFVLPTSGFDLIVVGVQVMPREEGNCSAGPFLVLPCLFYCGHIFKFFFDWNIFMVEIRLFGT